MSPSFVPCWEDTGSGHSGRCGIGFRAKLAAPGTRTLHTPRIFWSVPLKKMKKLSISTSYNIIIYIYMYNYIIRILYISVYLSTILELWLLHHLHLQNSMIFYVISSLRPRTMLQLLFAHRDTTLLRSGGWLGSRLTSIGLHVEPTETQSRHISKLKLTISHKNKGHTHTHLHWRSLIKLANVKA